MTKRLNFAGWALILTVIISACSPAVDRRADRDDEKAVHPVKVMTLTMDSVERTIHYTCNLIAFEEVNHAPSQPGRIDRIFVEVGDRVTRGQALIKMDQTQLIQARLQLEDARTHFKRMDTLYDMNSISKQQYDQAKTQYELAASSLEHLRENTVLNAPFNGIITGKYYEDGEIYSGAPNTESGKAAILTLMQISPLKAMVSISEKYFPDIREDMPATLRSDIYPNTTFTGTIYRVHPTISTATRTFQTEVKVDNPGEQLRPGMFARVEIKLKSDAVLLAPAIAVVKQEGTNNRHVFIHENGMAHEIPVKIGDRFDDQIELLSGEIKEGMELIVAGQTNLMNGDAVKVYK
ncbi:MAG: efflux RND transporter periplasmic adaptor subunit [Bacteroidales bacterium]